MCGIAAVYGEYAAVKSLLLTLNQLERGKQGCGVAYLINSKIKILKEPIHPILFSEIWIKELNINTNVAISHNRLPSVGRVSYENTHPFLSCDNTFAFAHNGHTINGNLRPQLKAKGHVVLGETDSEILMHLLEDCLKEHGDMATAIQDLILNYLNGTIAVLTKKGELYFAKSGFQPLHYTITEGEVYMASSANAIRTTLRSIGKTKFEIKEVKDGEVVIVDQGEVEHLPSIKPNTQYPYFNIDYFLNYFFNL